MQAGTAPTPAGDLQKSPVCDYTFSSFPQREIFAVAVYIGFWLFDYILVPLSAKLVHNRILPDKAKRNTVLNVKDNLFVQFNRIVTVLFLYHMVSLACSPNHYSMENIFAVTSSWQNTLRQVLQTLAIFSFIYFPVVIVIYDFFYAIFHRILHIEWLYPLIHKHHHLQYTPWRGNVDAINTHPIEYVLGEYNHLWSLFVVSNMANKFFGYKPHAIFVLLYIVIAGLLSTLNHTRVDVRIPYLYNVWWHDLHHRVPPSNYGQYTMLWDYIFGWYKEETTKSLVDDNEVGGGNTRANDRKSILATAVAARSSAAVAKTSTVVPRTTATSTTTTSRKSSASPKKSVAAASAASPSPKKAARSSSTASKKSTGRASSSKKSTTRTTSKSPASKTKRASSSKKRN